MAWNILATRKPFLAGAAVILRVGKDRQEKSPRTARPWPEIVATFALSAIIIGCLRAGGLSSSPPVAENRDVQT
jgi:hypothetical protein